MAAGVLIPMACRFTGDTLPKVGQTANAVPLSTLAPRKETYACQTGLAVPGELKSIDAMWNTATNVDGGVSNREAKRAYRPTLHMHSHTFRQIGSRNRPPAAKSCPAVRKTSILS